MGRIRASAPDSFTFRPNDTPATRAQKLELIRRRAAEPAVKSIQIAFVDGLPDAGQLLWRAVAVEALTLSALSAEADDAATAEAVYELKADDVTVATITWAAAGTVATCAIITSALVEGASLKLYAAAPQDATLANGTIVLTVSAD